MVPMEKTAKFREGKEPTKNGGGSHGCPCHDRIEVKKVP